MKVGIHIDLNEAVYLRVLDIDAGGKLSPARVKVEYVLANRLPVVRWLNIEESLVLSLRVNYDFE